MSRAKRRRWSNGKTYEKRINELASRSLARLVGRSLACSQARSPLHRAPFDRFLQPLLGYAPLPSQQNTTLVAARRKIECNEQGEESPPQTPSAQVLSCLFEFPTASRQSTNETRGGEFLFFPHNQIAARIRQGVFEGRRSSAVIFQIFFFQIN